MFSFCILAVGDDTGPTSVEEEAETEKTEEGEKKTVVEMEKLKDSFAERERHMQKIIAEARKQAERDREQIERLTKERDDANEIVAEALSQKFPSSTGQSFIQSAMFRHINAHKGLGVSTASELILEWGRRGEARSGNGVL